MSPETAQVFTKHRDAIDPQGNLAWVARVHQKALRATAAAQTDPMIEEHFALSDPEKILWRLLRLPRKIIDLENVGLLETEKVRGFLRGLLAAESVEVLEPSEAKAIVPAEIRRLRNALAGIVEERRTAPLKPRVFRPAIEGLGDAPSEARPSPTPVAADRKVTRTPVAAVDLSPADVDTKASIERVFAAMGTQNHFEFLGVPPDASDGGVKQAYMRMAREFHPDRIASTALVNDDEVMRKVDQIFKRLGDAQTAAATAESRSAYIRSIASSGGATATADGKKQRRPVEAQNAARMADTFTKKRDFKQAEFYYRQAVNFDPEDGRIATAFAWCLYLNPDAAEAQRAAEAKRRLTEVTQKHKIGDTHYKLGIVLRKLGDEAGAQQQFAKAAELDPRHTDALREVRLSQMREKKTESDKSDLGAMAGSFLSKLRGPKT